MKKFFILKHLASLIPSNTLGDESAMIKSAIEMSLSNMGYKVDVDKTLPVLNDQLHEFMDAVEEYVEEQLLSESNLDKTKVCLVETNRFQFTAEFY